MKGRARRRGGRRGFNLVEVLLAMAVAAFALVGILGLMAANYRTGNSAREDTALAEMARYVSAELQKQILSPSFSAAAAQTDYFDVSGNPLASSTGAYYLCTVTFPYAPGVSGLSVADANVAGSLVVVKMTFAWPLAAAAANRNQKVLHATLDKL